MPPVESLAGIPTITDEPNLATLPTGGGNGHAIPLVVVMQLHTYVVQLNDQLS